MCFHYVMPSSVQFQNTVRQKETACEEAKNNYWLTVENTNKVQRQHYESDMPAIFTVGVAYASVYTCCAHTQAHNMCVIQGFAEWLSLATFDSRLTFELRPYFKCNKISHKWVRSSELSCESTAVRDNHFAKPCRVCVCMPLFVRVAVSSSVV